MSPPYNLEPFFQQCLENVYTGNSGKALPKEVITNQKLKKGICQQFYEMDTVYQTWLQRERPDNGTIRQLELMPTVTSVSHICSAARLLGYRDHIASQKMGNTVPAVVTENLQGVLTHTPGHIFDKPYGWP